LLQLLLLMLAFVQEPELLEMLYVTQQLHQEAASTSC
jgi:hypothetical protein